MPTASPPLDLTAAADVLRDPAKFARVFLASDPWGTQEDILRAIAEYPLVAVKACHASGKTYIAAEAVLWWLARFPDGKVITTAPTWRQVSELLWSEIRVACKRSSWPFPTPLTTELRIDRDSNYAIGLSTDEPDKFQGFHGTILIVVDEATGVAAPIFEAMEGIRSGGKVHILLLGNPTSAAGAFFDAFASSAWHKITIDAFDTPNLQGLPGANAEERENFLARLPAQWDRLNEEEKALLTESPRPYLITRRWVWEKLNDWGDMSPIYQSRVRGRFPIEGEDSLFSLAWIERSAAIHYPEDDELDEEFGLDVAGPGQAETVLYGRRGRNVATLRRWSAADSRGGVVNALGGRLQCKVKVDAVGIGYHMWTHLKSVGYNAWPVVAGGKPREKKRFVRLKDEMAWTFRDMLKEGEVAGIKDEDTIAQLLKMRYEMTPDGRVEIVSKKKAGGKSPDRADALIMCYVEAEMPPLRCY